MAEYAAFMNEETWLYSRRYARSRVVVHNGERLTQMPNGARSVLAFLHYGSFFLMGGALVHHLGLEYSAIASRRNALALHDVGKHFWLGVYRRADQLYGTPLLYTDQSPRLALDWLKRPRHMLGVAMDVREVGRSHDEQRFRFMGNNVYMQTGAARLARIARLPLTPVLIHYRRDEQRHHLYIEEPIEPKLDPDEMIQRALDQLAPHIAADPMQQFHDIGGHFANPHSP